MAQEAMTIGETETDWIREKLYDAAYEAVSGIENEHGITFTEAEREALIDKFREGFYQ